MNAEGYFGVGGSVHCVHTTHNRLSRIVDLVPFQYMSMYCSHQPAWVGPDVYVIFEMTPLDDHQTKLSFRLRTVKRDRVTREVARVFASRRTRAEFDYDRLRHALERSDSVAATEASLVAT
jgi:hypothetical protein